MIQSKIHIKVLLKKEVFEYVLYDSSQVLLKEEAFEYIFVDRSRIKVSI